MHGRNVLAVCLSLVPAPLFADPEPLAPYPTDTVGQLEFLSRCAGLVRAMTFARIDLEHYRSSAPDAFNEKSNRFWKVIRPRTMEHFGFDPEDLTDLGEGRKQKFHAFIVSAGVDQAIERAAGFYETMSQFRESAPDWGQIVNQDFETCGAAEFE